MLKYLRHSVLNYLRTNVVAYFFLVLVFIIGVVVGSFAVRVLPEQQKLELVGYLQTFFQGLSQAPENIADPNAMILSVIFRNCKTITMVWLLGFTIIGIPFVLLILFTRGFVIGFTVGFLINEYVMKGLLFALAAVLPHNLIAVPALLVTAVSATSFSLMLVKRKKHTRVNLLYAALSYSFLCFIMVLFMVIASLVEVYVSPVFMKTIAGFLIK